MDDDFIYDNEDETEMGQLHSIHFSLNAINAVRRAISTGPSLKDCADCGGAIPLQRLEAVQGCRRCTPCQTEAEATKF